MAAAMRSTAKGCMLCASTRLFGGALISFVSGSTMETVRALSVRERVDEDGGFVAVLQGIREVEAANAKIDYACFRGQTAACEAADDLDAESVVAEEDVADAGDEDCWLDGFLRVIVFGCPDLAGGARFRPG